MDKRNYNSMHEAVQFYWGERCPEYVEGCGTCEAWKQYDAIIAVTPEELLYAIEAGNEYKHEANDE